MATKINDHDFEVLMSLAKLKLPPEELQKIRGDIQNILDMVAKIQAVDTSGIKPTAQITGLENVTRDDKTANYDVSAEALMNGAPDSSQHQIKVPKVK